MVNGSQKIASNSEIERKEKGRKLSIFIVVSLMIIVLVFGSASVIFMIKNSQKTPVCSPGTKICNEKMILTCASNGGKYLAGEKCSLGCENGQCTKACVPKTCVDLSKNCGAQFDGCGKTIECGECRTGYVCDNGQCAINEKSFNFTTTSFSEEYDEARKAAGISDDYIRETWYYNYGNDTLQKVLNGLPYTSDPKKATKNIISTVFRHITYDNSTQNGAYCYGNQASDIWNNKKGVCSTISRVDIALLRGAGLAARAVTGCVRTNLRCDIIMTALSPEQIFKKEVREGDKYIIGAYNGGAHVWVEVWLPNTGWTTVESTSSYIIKEDCLAYQIYSREEEYSPQADECTINTGNSIKCKEWLAGEEE